MESTLTFSQAQWDSVVGFVRDGRVCAGRHLRVPAGDQERRPRPSTARRGSPGPLTLVSFLAYLLLIVSWITGFDFKAATSSFVPSGSALQFRNGYRYVDWAITVPILTMELSIISTLVGAKARAMRQLWIPLAFIMVVTGFIGDDVFNGTTGTSRLGSGLDGGVHSAVLPAAEGGVLLGYGTAPLRRSARAPGHPVASADVGGSTRWPIWCPSSSRTPATGPWGVRSPSPSPTSQPRWASVSSSISPPRPAPPWTCRLVSRPTLTGSTSPGRRRPKPNRFRSKRGRLQGAPHRSPVTTTVRIPCRTSLTEHGAAPPAGGAQVDPTPDPHDR